MTAERPPFRPGIVRRWTRRLLRTAIGSLILLLLVDTWLVEGLLVGVVVTSGSMTPALLGPHRRWRCVACERAFVCSRESLPEAGHAAICPNCGAENDSEQGTDLPGRRVLIDRSAYLWRAPRRWEAVVLRCPDRPESLCVKRVVGRPGEVVRIAQGDIFVDGTIAAKNDRPRRSLAVEVYDAPDKDERWQAKSGGWQMIDGHYVHAESAAAPRRLFQRPRRLGSRRIGPAHWLAYRHPQPSRPGQPPAFGPVLDESTCDQNESRVLSPVHDIALACELETTGDGLLTFVVNAGHDSFVFQLNVGTGEGELMHNGRPVGLATVWPDVFASGGQLQLAVADHRAQVVLNSEVVVAHEFEPSAEPAAPGLTGGPASHSPLAADELAGIAAEGLRVELRSLKILRDVYYLPAPVADPPAEYRLGSDEYFLLGDNSPHAVDSRLWPAAGIRRELLLGRVLAW